MGYAFTTLIKSQGSITAVVLHTLWDSSGSLIGTAVVAVISLGALAYSAHRAGREAAPRTVAYGGPV